ncbi:MAG: hypothetical protein H0T65_15155, partial [Deltaproteobacteria bacterium]|nr:hypothetical protein [Deltaproteobacteria bacterium]
PTFTEAELPAITPLEFVVTPGEGGLSTTTLDVREGEFEQTYSLQDPYSYWMFVALCRREGLTVYKRPRQRATTVCVKTTVSKHDALWQRFRELSRQLGARLGEATHQFVREHIEAAKR